MSNQNKEKKGANKKDDFKINPELFTKQYLN